jgi:hypothetical protein
LILSIPRTKSLAASIKHGKLLELELNSVVGGLLSTIGIGKTPLAKKRFYIRS